MDMTPPSSPPLHAGTTQAERQGAALTRLITLERWLEQCERDMPAPPAPGMLTGIDTHLAALHAFWNATDTSSGLVRQRAFANHLAQAMQDEAGTRIADGTLDMRAAPLLRRLASLRHVGLADGILASEIMLGHSAYAGGLVVQNATHADLVLVFLPERGWESFRSADSARDYLRHQLLPQAGALPGITADEAAQAALDDTVDLRPIIGDTFDSLAARFIDVQAEKITQAWDDYTLDRALPEAATRFLDDLRDHQRMTSQFDIAALLDLREARLVEQVRQERLAPLPTQVRKDWKRSLRSYNRALADTAMLRDAIGLSDPDSMAEHASRLLTGPLTSLGIEADPADIQVEITPLPNPGSPSDIGTHLISGPATRTVSLVELAIRDIGQYDLESYRALDIRGVPLSPKLGHAAIKTLIREADIGASYQAYLDTLFNQGKRGDAARALAKHLQAARMRFEAEDARLSYHLPDEPRSFADDNDEQGFRWVDAVLRSPAASRRDKVNQHGIVVNQVTYKDIPVNGLLVFGSRHVASVSRVVLYTPGAPDGMVFREFADRQEAARKFFYHPAYREYLLDRLPAEFARPAPMGQSREFRGDTRSHWVLGADQGSAYTLTAEPFAEKEIHGDFLDAMYDANVGLHKQDALYVSRDRQHADLESVLGHPLADALFSPGAQFIASALVEIPASAIRAVQASWRFYDHVKAGDSRSAFLAFTEGYTSALNIVTPPMLGNVVKAPLVRAGTGSTTLVPSGVSTAARASTFESSYVARQVVPRTRADRHGIHRIDGRNYVAKDGLMYPVRYDEAYGYWRLEKPSGSLDASFSGPAIERVGEHWEYARHIGLEGGMRRALRERMRRVLRLDDDAAPAAQPPEAPAARPAIDPMGWFPPNAEHLRPQVMAALADNPTGQAMVRRDGARFHIALRSTTARITRDRLSAELSELSIYQRRMFMHELETRFPVAAERARVLDELGLARGGRRLSSPPRSPTRSPYRGDDGQVPVVSSTTADDAAGAAATLDEIAELPVTEPLDAGQLARWNEALQAARNHPRVSPRAPGASEATVVPGQIMPRDAWPERVWLYVDEVPFYSPNGTVELRLPPRIPRQSATRQNRFRVTDLPPETGRSILDDVLAVPASRRQAFEHDMWIEVDTRALRDIQVANGEPAYDFYRATHDQGGHRFSLRSWFHELRLPAGSYRMGMRPD